MIVVTGAAGFIGSNIVNTLLDDNTEEIIAVCDRELESPNLNKYYEARGRDHAMAPEDLFTFLHDAEEKVTAIIHMGATTSTTERDTFKLLTNNVRFTMNLWMWCAINQIRLIYASSASVYGNSATFWDTDKVSRMKEFVPLNDYGWSKLATDMAINTLMDTNILQPPQCIGLRFFNVYGPNEWHKADQASIITKAMGKTEIELFDVEATRDFVYVKDCVEYVMRFLDRPDIMTGIYNIGTEQARPFTDIAAIMGLSVKPIPMPEELKSQYQFHTKADMNKLKYRGLWFPPTSLEDGIKDYEAGTHDRRGNASPDGG